MNNRTPNEPDLQRVQSFGSVSFGDTQAHFRLCLKCRKPFLSTWPGHRLCDKCREENEGLSEMMAKGYIRDKRAGRDPVLEDEIYNGGDVEAGQHGKSKYE